MWKVGPGGKLLIVVLGLGLLAYTAERYVGRERLRRLAGVKRPPPVVLTAVDFPAGASAPLGDLAVLPVRPLRVAAPPRGASAALLLAAGGVGNRHDALAPRAYGVEVDVALVAEESAIAHALVRGGDLGGYDAAVVSVDRLAQLNATARDARLKAVLLLSRSRGHDVLATSGGVNSVAGLKGRRVAVALGSPDRFFLMWSLAQALVSPGHVELVAAPSTAQAAMLFQQGAADAVVGLAPELGNAIKARGARVLSTSADAPHLIAHVLAVRAEVLARFPDAARRLAAALLDAAETTGREPLESARLLSLSAPAIGDPFEALRSEPPAGLADNLAFFGVRGDCPVRFDELYGSAAALWTKLGEPADKGAPSATRELAPLVSAQGLLPPPVDPAVPVRKPQPPPPPPAPATAATPPT